MKPDAWRDSRLDFHLTDEFKRVVEEAAFTLSLSVDDFAVSTLIQHARAVIQQRNVTELTNRDRDRFLALLDDAEPNPALLQAAARYKNHLG